MDEGYVVVLTWLRTPFRACGRASQRLLVVADGSYDTLELWKQLPDGVILLARSAKNRVLYHRPGAPTGLGRPRKYGDRAPSPQTVCQQRHCWQNVRLRIRGHTRPLQSRVEGRFLRPGAPQRPLFLLIVRGQTYSKHGRRKHREPVPYLINAVLKDGVWTLPLPPRHPHLVGLAALGG